MAEIRHRDPAAELARDLVLDYGWNATAYQILNPGIDLWFSEGRRAVVGYTMRTGVLLVAGSPVCEETALLSVCDEFERFAQRQGLSVCYVCAETRLQKLFASSPGHATAALGAQPAWDPFQWPELIRTRASLRAQLNRARNRGVVVEPVAPERAEVDPALRRVLRDWIGSRSLPPLHFLVEPNLLNGELRDRIVLVASYQGTAVAFMVASPVRARRGYLFELLARSSFAPNGSIELLIDAAMRRLRMEGCRYATLGLVALAHAADPQIRSNPAWLRTLMYFARAHANRFYNFKGLEHFRTKMSPACWEPIYAISNERRFSVRTLYAIGSAFSGISPWVAILLGFARAAEQEIRAIRWHREKD